MSLSFKNLKGDSAGGLQISNALQYRLNICNQGDMDFPTNLPDAREKIWRITKTRISDDMRLQIHCNDVEVVNTLLSTCTDDRWRKYWSRKVEIIYFNKYFDTASDYYRPYQGIYKQQQKSFVLQKFVCLSFKIMDFSVRIKAINPSNYLAGSGILKKNLHGR